MADTQTQDKPRHVYESSPYSVAVALAAKWHGGQMDDDGLPHLAHSLRVAESLPDHLKPAGALHDVLEDTGCTYDEIVAAVDDMTAQIVATVTKQPQDRTYAAYIDRILAQTGAAGAAARSVKLADLRDNLERSFNEANWSRVRRYAQALDKFAKRREGGGWRGMG